MYISTVEVQMTPVRYKYQSIINVVDGLVCYFLYDQGIVNKENTLALAPGQLERYTQASRLILHFCPFNIDFAKFLDVVKAQL